MMIFLDEIFISSVSVKFWSGFDIDEILRHPKDGTKGFMIVLINSVEEEKIKFQRDSKLKQIFGEKSLDFDNLLSNLDNSYLALYQSRGENELLVNILKEKFNKSLDWQRFTNI